VTCVSAMSVSPRYVPPLFALESPVLRGFVEGNRGVALPSEGRGHRFESCRVRQFSAIYFLTSQNVFGVC
jgi:hypothetical protein